VSELTFPPASDEARDLVSRLKVRGWKLRPCRTADMPFLRRLYRRSREAELLPTGWPEDMKRQFCDQQFAAQHADYLRRYPAAAFLIIVGEHGPAGRLYLARTGDDLRLVDVSLLPTCRSRGFGTALLAMLQAHARDMGCGIELSVAMDNARAEALYRRHGFVDCGTGPTHRTMRWQAAPSPSVRKTLGH
jgi:ribosomal protein S18 acetylase RimI-like enzyme